MFLWIKVVSKIEDCLLKTFELHLVMATAPPPYVGRLRMTLTNQDTVRSIYCVVLKSEELNVVCKDFWPHIVRSWIVGCFGKLQF